MLRLPPFQYHQPRGLGDALALLAEHGDEAMPVAGGTDVVPNMKHRLHEPGHLVSLRRVPELRGIDVTDDAVTIGAAETLADVAADPRVARRLPALADAARHVAGPQLRNAATLGGNICLDTRCTYYNQTYGWRRALGFCLKKDGDTCHVTGVGKKCVAAHSADTPPVLWVLGAELLLASTAGERTVPVEEFFVADGIRNTIREEGEILVRVRIPMPRAGTRMAYRKLRQRGSIDFPLLNMAAAARVGGDSGVEGLRLVVSGLGSRPREVGGLESVLEGGLDEPAIQAVAERAHQQCRPLTNMIVDPEWRRAMVPVYVARLLRDLTAQSTTGAPD
jgi:4-hydroxybenzoyl-CoA reductase subunit beta